MRVLAPALAIPLFFSVPAWSEDTGGTSGHDVHPPAQSQVAPSHHGSGGAGEAAHPGATTIDAKEHGDAHGAGGHVQTISTENLFGFTGGSDMDPAGSRTATLELGGGFGKREGDYSAIVGRLGLGYAVTNNLSVGVNLFGGYRDIHNNPELEPKSSIRFDGIGTEVRLRLLDRRSSPVGVTLQIEPMIRTASAETGRTGFGGGAENKLIVDTALIPDSLFAAVNVIYNFESFKPSHEDSADRASTFGVSGALAARVAPGLFLGGELRYLRAYEGLGLSRFRGDALFMGPTLSWQPAHNITVSSAFSAQVSGRSIEDHRNLDLTDFSRYQAKLKVVVEF